MRVDPYRDAAPPTSIDNRELGPRYLAIRAHADCQGCARPVPVNAPISAIQCPACATTMRLSPNAFEKVVESFERDHRSLRRAEVEVGRLHATIWPAKAGDRSALVSTAAPKWLAERCPTARVVWLAPRDEATEAEVTYGCPSCQTAMRLRRASPRVNACPSCRARVFTPESLWALLHGTSRMRTWIVELHGENQFDRERRLEREHAARRHRAEALAAREKAEQEAARSAHRKAKLAHDFTRLHRIAKWVTSVHALLVVAAIAVPWVAGHFGIGLFGVVFGGYFATLIGGALGLGAGASIITRVTGDQDLMFPVWFNFVFVTIIPVIGHLLGFEAIYGLRSGRYAERYGRHGNYAALNWAIITFGGLAFVTSLLLACLL